MLTSLYIIWLVASLILIALAVIYTRGCGPWPVILISVSIVAYASLSCMDQEIENYHNLSGSAVRSPEEWLSHRSGGIVYRMFLPVLPVDIHGIIIRSLDERGMTYFKKYHDAHLRTYRFIERWMTIAAAAGVIGILLVIKAPHSEAYRNNARARSIIGRIVAVTCVATCVGHAVFTLITDTHYYRAVLHPLTIVVETLIGAGSIWGIPSVFLSLLACYLIVASSENSMPGTVVLALSHFWVGACLVLQYRWDVLRYLPDYDWTLFGRCSVIVLAAIGAVLLVRRVHKQKNSRSANKGLEGTGAPPTARQPPQP